MVKDPICGKDVDTLRARAVGIFGGVTYYFCSADCKARFVDPRATAREPAAAGQPPPAGAAKRPPLEKENDTEAPQARYAHSRIRRVTGEVGTPVVQIDLSPNKKPQPPAPALVDEDPLEPARSGRGWTLLAIVMLIIAGGVIFFTLKHR